MFVVDEAHGLMTWYQLVPQVCQCLSDGGGWYANAFMIVVEQDPRWPQTSGGTGKPLSAIFSNQPAIL